MNVRLRMYEYSYSNLGSVYAKGLLRIPTAHDFCVISARKISSIAE